MERHGTMLRVPRHSRPRGAGLRVRGLRRRRELVQVRRRGARRAHGARRDQAGERGRLDDARRGRELARGRARARHQARKPPPNASPAPIVSTTSTARRRHRRPRRRRHHGAPSAPRVSSATRRPGVEQRAGGVDRLRAGIEPGEVLLADLDDVACGRARARAARGRRRGRAMIAGRQFGSSMTSACPRRCSTTASSAVAIGSSTRPSVPTCRISTPAGSAASAASGVRPGRRGRALRRSGSGRCPSASSSASASVVGLVGARRRRPGARRPPASSARSRAPKRSLDRRPR